MEITKEENQFGISLREKFLEQHVFAADYYVDGSNKLSFIVSSKEYAAKSIVGKKSEWEAIRLGSLIILKHSFSRNQLTIGAIGAVIAKNEAVIEVDWASLIKTTAIAEKVSLDGSFQLLSTAVKEILYDTLKSNNLFKTLVEESYLASRKLFDFDRLMDQISKNPINSELERSFFLINHPLSDKDYLSSFQTKRVLKNIFKIQKDSFNGIRPGDIVFLSHDSSDLTKYEDMHFITAIGFVYKNYGDGERIDLTWHSIEKRIRVGKLSYPTNSDDLLLLSQRDVITIIRSLQKEVIDLESFFSELSLRWLHPDSRTIAEIIKSTFLLNYQYWWINASDKWQIDKLREGDIESYAAKGAKGKYQKYVKEIAEGDLLIGYQARPDKNIIGVLEITQSIDKDERYYFKLIHKFENRTTLEELKQLPLFGKSPLSKSLQGSLHKLDKELFKEILSTTELKSSLEEDPAEKDSLVNNFFRTHIDNDNAYTSKDLLDIENDVRSFALLLAARDIKPPLAIALFGRWGTGKSFFMRHLASRVTQLSEHQGFIEESSTSNQTANTTQSDLFCKGIAQIEFNAWSYLDANLWAGLISSIFEKLDEYISDRSKGEEAKLEIRKKLSEKLHVLASEKQIIEEKKEDLIKSKKSLSKELNELKASKSEILRKVADIKLDDLFNMVRKEVKLKPEDQEQLEQYGFSPERIRLMNPNALNEEVQSWITFARSVFQFSPKYIFWFSLCFLLVVLIAFNPDQIITKYIDVIGRKVLIYAGIVLPILSKWYDSFSRFKELVKPVSDYKNEYNRKMEEAHFEYQKDIDLLEANLISKDHEIADKAKELEVVKKKIEAVEYSLDHFLAQRAFNDFVRRKITDRQYDSHLGLISIIRRDFETLSDLFSDIQVDEMASPEVQLKQEKTKAEHDELSVLFEDEKTLDRIILYIDDLDRCADDKVLEVIQAVHLLMAFPLFNVIVGVDKRCVRNALLLKTKLEYRRIAPIDEIKEMGIEMINPGEYLEKIFQIPFELKDPTGKDVKHLVNSLLETSRISLEQIEIPEQVKPEPNEVAHTQVDKSELIAGNKVEEVSQEYIKTATRQPDQFDYIREEIEMDKVIEQTKAPLVSSAPENLQLTREELTLLPEIMFLVGSTPRTIKRYLNIYKLIRSHAMLKYQQESQQDVCLFIMFLLAMGIGNYRGTAKDFFNKLIQHHDKSLSEILSRMNKEGEKDNKVMELEALSAQIAAVEGISKILTFTPDMLDGDIIPFVSRFSFAKETVIEV